MSLSLSGSQTVGPYFAIGLSLLCSEEIICGDGAESLVVEGQLFDGNGTPIPDAFLEIWQADSSGRYSSTPGDSSTNAVGFGRIATDTQGRFRFKTIKPGSVAYDAERMQAPHLLVLLYMRGLLRQLVTRLYFPEEPANLTDPVLQRVPAGRRSTLIARAGNEPGTLYWEIVMRQREVDAKPETVFFSW